MQFLRMVKSELRRLLSDKKRLIIFFAVFAAVIVLVTVFLCSLGANKEVADADELTARYEQYYELYHSWYLYEMGEAPCPGNPNQPPYIQSYKSLKELCDYYKFLLDTNTTQYDYIETMPVFDMYATLKEYNGSCSMLKIAQYAFYPLVLFSIIWTVISCISPYESGIMKNYFASPLDKRAIMGGKLFSSWLVNFCIWGIVAVWGLVFGCFGKQIFVLNYTADGYVATPSATVFIVVMLGTLFAMSFTCCFTVLVGQFIKKSLPTALTGAAFLVVLLLLCAVIFSVDIEQILAPNTHCVYFPVLGLNNVLYNLADWRTWVAFAFHIAVGVVMTVITLKMQTGRELRSRVKQAEKSEK